MADPPGQFNPSDLTTRVPHRPIEESAPTVGVPSGAVADFGRYHILEELGRGGMGVVYRARDMTLGRDVALKVLHVAARVNEETIGRFQREARAAAALDHPNIVRVHDVGALPNGSPFYTMEVLAGQDLAHAIAEGRVAPKEAAEAVRQVSLALLYAHQKGILHRDIKPQNIFLRHDPSAGAVHALLLDFGLAKLAEHDLSSHGSQSLQSLTRSGEIFGTPAYMPPEQARGARDVDARADIYSLGAALYHALAGRPPFEAPSLKELMDKVESLDPPPPSALNSEVDADLDTLTLKCLQKDPKDRYQNAGELAEDLRRWLAGDAISARPIGRVGRLWRKARRNKAVAIPVALLVAAAVVSLLWFGGGAAWDRMRLARWQAAAEKALREGRYKEAEDPSRKAAELAPSVRLYSDLLAQSLAGQKVEEGRLSVHEYRAHRDRILQLKGDLKAASEAEKASTPESRPGKKAKRWAIEGELQVEESGRGSRHGRVSAWSDAVVKMNEAITLWSGQQGARAALAELYWDRYLQAEQERDHGAEQMFGPLVSEFGGEEYAKRLRCERCVRVTFRLPKEFAAKTLDAWLYQYKLKMSPPVEVPVPFDLDLRVAPDDSPLLAAEPAFGAPVPLADIAQRAGEAREGSVFALPRAKEAHLPLTVQRDGEGRPFVRFDRTFARGSYLLFIPEGQGLYETRYPFEVARDLEWDEECELVADGAPKIPPAMPAQVGRYWIYVPAGPYRAGGDAAAIMAPFREGGILRVSQGDGVPLAEARAGGSLPTEGFFLARFSVLSGTYLAYLDDRGWHTKEKAFTRCPRGTHSASDGGSYWPQKADGTFQVRWSLDQPVLGIDRYDAEDFCKWLTRTKGGGEWEFLLPTEDEWEKAARGVDGRFFPWGDSFDNDMCRTRESRPVEQEVLQPEEFGLFPLDEGPYGARDMAGCVAQSTSTTTGGIVGGNLMVEKGGAWLAPPNCSRCASRDSSSPEMVHTTNGFRVEARRLPPPR